MMFLLSRCDVMCVYIREPDVGSNALWGLPETVSGFLDYLQIRSTF